MKKEIQMEQNKVKKSISALDVFIIILAVLCIAGVAVRLWAGDSGILPINAPEKTEHSVSFEITGIKTVLSSNLTTGEKLYTADGVLFGTVGENVAVTPALLIVEGADGRYTQVFAGADNGDNSLVDIRGTIVTEGYYEDYGYMVGGSVYSAPNSEIVLHTDKAEYTFKITDVAKVDVAKQ